MYLLRIAYCLNAILSVLRVLDLSKQLFSCFITSYAIKYVCNIKNVRKIQCAQIQYAPSRTTNSSLEIIPSEHFEKSVLLR